MGNPDLPGTENPNPVLVPAPVASSAGTAGTDPGTGTVASDVPPSGDTPSAGAASHAPSPPPTEVAIAQLTAQMQRASDAYVAIANRIAVVEKSVTEVKRHVASPPVTLPPVDSDKSFVATPKLPPMRRIDGKKPTALRNWFESAKTYLAAARIEWESLSAVSFLAAHFEGDLAKWWTFRVNAHDGDAFAGLTSASELQTVAMSFHAERAPDEDARDKISKLTQRGSVLSYAHRLQELLLHLPDRTEGDKVHNFTSGLKPKVKTEVVLKNPKTLDEAIKLAVEADALLLQHGLIGKKGDSAEPMELGSAKTTATSGKYQRLSKDEKERLRKSGGCFYCRSTEHQIKDCPVRPERE